MFSLWCVLFVAALLQCRPAVAQAGNLSGYAPFEAACPSKNLLRRGHLISQKETEWLQKRHKITTKALIEFIEDKDIGVDVKSLLANSSQPVNIAVSLSGGGYRALLVGAGEVAALDSRSRSDSPLSGVLQLASYISGLSGGAWLLGLLTLQNWPAVLDVVLNNTLEIWDFSEDNQMIDTSHPVSMAWDVISLNFKGLLSHLKFWDKPKGKGLKADIDSKEGAGFHTSITDVWGRALAHQLFMKEANWLNSVKWSDIREINAFANHEMPFPLLTALARKPNDYDLDFNSPVIEFNPFETGSFDTSLQAFFDTQYLGTKVENGKPTSGKCIKGFDNGAFIIGTSSSLFNEFLNTLVCEDCHELNFAVKWAVKKLLLYFSKRKQDIALFNPNPFKGTNVTKGISNNETLFLTDGGLAGENIPLSTIMTTERKLDAVFAFENNPNMPNGSSLTNIYRRQFTKEGRSIISPYLPGENTFNFLNLTAKPTFFGCDARNQTKLAKNGVIPPIVIYMANRPFEYYSNTSLFKLDYDDYQKKKMIQNGYDIATRLNSTLDDEWGECVGCALIRRTEERQGKKQSEKCKQCFERYCWDGSLVEPLYPRPVNYTLTGLTNASMTLLGNGSGPEPLGAGIWKKIFPF